MYVCTICGDEGVEFGKIHKHNPNGKPIDVIKQFILVNAPGLWDDEIGI